MPDSTDSLIYVQWWADQGKAPGDKARGIQYSKLVPVLLREVQKLRDELNQMKVN